MSRRYVTLDVFTDRIFGGNPLAVVLDAQSLTTAQMQSIAAEFNYSETSFVLPARDPGHTAHVRIFTPRTEVPFAGHPNVGTAVAIAREMESAGRTCPQELVFEEAAGLVPLSLLREGGAIVGAELAAPQSLTVGPPVPVRDAAECLSLVSDEVKIDVHPPRIVSVGLPFLAVELRTREALRRSKPVLAVHERVLPPAGTDSVFAYVRGAAGGELQARMYSPLDAIVEDPATGSATAATIAMLASIGAHGAAGGARAEDHGNADLTWRIEQGVDLGRPSLLLGRTSMRGGQLRSVHIAGRAVTVMRGELPLLPS